jgi:type IV secretion system protein VirB11
VNCGLATTADRVVLIEDTRELQCKAPNLVALRTIDGVASLSDLVRSSLRLRPDRIPIGEVRGSEALDLLKAWGTGHPAGSARSTQAPRSGRCGGSNSSSRKRSLPPRAPSSLKPST